MEVCLYDLIIAVPWVVLGQRLHEWAVHYEDPQIKSDEKSTPTIHKAQQEQEGNMMSPKCCDFLKQWIQSPMVSKYQWQAQKFTTKRTLNLKDNLNKQTNDIRRPI